MSPRTAWLSHGWREILNRTAALSRISLFPFRNYPWNHHFRTPPLIFFQNCAPSRKMSYNCLLPGENTVTSSPFLIIPLEQNLLRRGLFVQPFSGVTALFGKKKLYCVWPFKCSGRRYTMNLLCF